MEPGEEEELINAETSPILGIGFTRRSLQCNSRPLPNELLVDPNDHVAFDLWDECIVPPVVILPSSDQQEYAHDLGLISVSGENNAKSTSSTHSNSDCADCSTQTVFDTIPLSTKVQEPFCGCFRNKRMGVLNTNNFCLCGEEDTEFDWIWDSQYKSWATQLQDDSREVRFHKHYSSGTAAIRGSRSLTGGQHYWEIKMISPVYGTDMMIGIGTAEADLNKNSTNFCSLLGSDSESWGLSYTGVFHHNGKSQCYSRRFGQGTIIGVHLDMWNGTLSYFKNRRPLGIACSGLKGKKLYPMVSSTAARSAMKMVCSRSFESSLQYFCCLALRKMVPSESSVLESIKMPPGLKNFLNNNLGWILGPVANFSSCQPVGYPSRHFGRRAKPAVTQTCPLFVVDRNKVPKSDYEPGTSQTFIYRSQRGNYCYRCGHNLSKRRKHTLEKPELYLSVSSDESDDESDEGSDFEAKRKH